MKGHIMKIGRLLVRLVVGGLFIGHGTQKLFAWFGGPGDLSADRALGIHDTGPAWARRRPSQTGAVTAGGLALLALRPR
jgi:putative oxidoreductase